MNINTFLLSLLVIAAYLNLYIKHKKSRRNKKRTELPLSSKEWNERIEDNSFKTWLDNRERLKR